MLLSSSEPCQVVPYADGVPMPPLFHARSPVLLKPLSIRFSQKSYIFLGKVSTNIFCVRFFHAFKIFFLSHIIVA